ncbi:ankyrin repeat-containing domain protein, partial [Triangularia setosa]
NARDSQDQTPLLYAAQKGHEFCMKLLYHHRADPTISDNFGQTALAGAAEEENTALLVVEGVDAGSRDLCGPTPHILAHCHGHEGIRQLLQKHLAIVPPIVITPNNWAVKRIPRQVRELPLTHRNMPNS